ncbi:MAG TPA: hypothetical protein VN039_00885, partial [Nitrospira sp.]|nr:hypothetical protein [Nitrospira sp.]
ERTREREVHVSFVLEKVGLSVFRNKNITSILQRDLPASEYIIDFPAAEAGATDQTMLTHVTQYMSDLLRPGEWVRGVKTISSVIQRKYVVIDLDDIAKGVIPEGSSETLLCGLKETIKTGVLPKLAEEEEHALPSITTSFSADQLIVGSEEQLAQFERIVGDAQTDVFVLSTFVAPQNDEKCDAKGKAQRERIWQALEKACLRGVRCHLFFGTSINPIDNTRNIQELSDRLSALRKTAGYVLVHRDSVKSHAKFVAADDGQGGVSVLMGSCNWLSSPFAALEVSVELRESNAVAMGLDLLTSIVSSLSSASRSVETLQFMAAELRRKKHRLESPLDASPANQAQLTVVFADDHERLLREVAHDADKRFICCTNKVGANMVPALFTPAEVAGRRLDDVRIYYSRQSGPVKRRHVASHRERLNGIVDLIGVRTPQVHGKFLAWDEDHIVVSSLNWGSQSGSAKNRLDEIGLYLRREGLACELLKKFEAALSDRKQEIH